LSSSRPTVISSPPEFNRSSTHCTESGGMFRTPAMSVAGQGPRPPDNVWRWPVRRQQVRRAEHHSFGPLRQSHLGKVRGRVGQLGHRRGRSTRERFSPHQEDRKAGRARRTVLPLATSCSRTARNPTGHQPHGHATAAAHRRPELTVVFGKGRTTRASTESCHQRLPAQPTPG